MSYTQSLYHIVIRTKYSGHTIVEEYEKELYAYLVGIAKNKKAFVYRIGGMPDHIHILADLHPTVSLSDFVRDLKEYSSKWLKTNAHFPDFVGWGEGYAAFSRSFRDRIETINYIKGQKEHHKKQKFENEYRAFLEENEVEIDERYFLKD